MRCRSAVQRSASSLPTPLRSSTSGMGCSGRLSSARDIVATGGDGSAGDQTWCATTAGLAAVQPVLGEEWPFYPADTVGIAQIVRALGCGAAAVAALGAAAVFASPLVLVLAGDGIARVVAYADVGMAG